MAGNSTDPGRSVTSKVTAILLSFADGNVHTLTDVACSADLPTSTAHRLASELVAWRLLERTEERSYRIALPLRMIVGDSSEPTVCSYTLTVMRALPVLEELFCATNTVARLGTLRGTHVHLLQPRTDRHTGRIHPESLLHSIVPAHAAASGKALLAFSPSAVADHVVEGGLPALTADTITSTDVLRQTLATIRLTRLATSHNELSYDTTAIAMPIFAGKGQVVAAIELDTTQLRGQLKPVASALAVACRSLSRQLTTELHVVNHRHTAHQTERDLSSQA